MEQKLAFVSAVTTESLLQDALHRLEAQIRLKLGDKSPDLAVFFFSPHFREHARQLRDELREILQVEHLIGFSADGVIGSQVEIEQQPAISLLAARLPGVEITPFGLQPDNWQLLFSDPQVFQQFVHAPEDVRLFLLFGDPFSTPMSELLEAFNRFYPGVPVAGGMASAGMAPGNNTLILNERVSPAGAVGVALSGNLDVDLVVSQGCRPIGKPLTVTAAHKNQVLGLENEPALFQIEYILDELREEEQELLKKGLYIGRAVDPNQERYGRGDFLIRGVTGVNRHSGAIAIGDTIQAGEVVQFYLRDAVTAREDLEMMLVPQSFREVPVGALLFSCNGRGRRLYEYPDGDISVIKESLGTVTLAGCFCAGEIGPIGGKNFLHGHTAILALIRPRAI